MSDRSSKSSIVLLSTAKMFDGQQNVYQHHSSELHCDMKFSVFIPPRTQTADGRKSPVLYWLSGLTCTDENFVIKAGAQRCAAKWGITLVTCDTSPRNVNIPGEDDSYDFGSGAGFYVDATVRPWKKHYRMFSYCTKELVKVMTANFEVDPQRQGIFGHSMGGHGALICALKCDDLFKSVSAFAPIANPINCPWGVKAFTGYLGEDRNMWKQWDATELAMAYEGPLQTVLIDQGCDDKFYVEGQLLPEHFEAACKDNGISVEVKLRDGYDHSYYYIATFIEEHIDYHAKILLAL